MTKTILILAANPKDTSRLRLDQEVREIDNGLQRARRRDEFTLKQVWAVRRSDFRRSMLDTKPNIVHFCGHGSGEEGIAFEDENGQTKLISTEALSGFFELFADTVECVVLNACYSEVQAEAIAKYIPHVIGMNEAIGDTAAIEFAVAFYDALGAGKTIEFAYKLACNAIQLSGLPENLTPILKSGQLASSIGQVKEDKSLLVESKALSRGFTRQQEWGDAPDVPVFFGRTKELSTLETWIVHEHCRLVTILGIGGVGKTNLSIKLGKGGIGKTDLSLTLAKGIQDNFDCVVWRSLLNAPPLVEVLREINHSLSNKQESKSVDELKQISQLIDQLREKHCLIILDNFESVLDRGGSYRNGLEAYGLLLKQVGSLNHNSCILLTSREKPPEVSRLEGDKRLVRTLELGGLDTSNGKKIFDQLGIFYGSDNEWDELIEFYNGNPLVLELTARHISQVFSGNISDFLTHGKAVFSNLQNILDWHFDRLPMLAKEIVYWLAVNREAVSIQELKSDVIPVKSSELVPSTLQSLQNLLPLEKNSHAFTLQPVLIEYATERLIESICTEINDGKIGILNQHALIKATGKDYVREQQSRLILEPVLKHFVNNKVLIRKLMKIITRIRKNASLQPGYATGNIINLLCFMKVDLSGYDFSDLIIWQAYLQGYSLNNVNFSNSDLSKSVFTKVFSGIMSTAFSPDGSLFASGDSVGDVHLWRTTDYQRICLFKGHSGFAWTIAFDPSGLLLASGSEDKTVRIWDIQTGHCITTLREHTSSVWSVAFSSDGKLLASSSDDQSIRIWDTNTWQCVRVMKEHTGWVWSVAFNSTGELLASGGEDKTVRLWELSTGHCIKTYHGHLERIWVVAFSPNGKLIASGSNDQTVKFWEIDTDQCIKTIKGQSIWLRSIAFSSDWQLMVSGGEDKTVRLWDVTKGECIKVFQDHTNRVRSVSFNANGKIFASGSDDQTIRLWDTTSNKCLKTLQGDTSWIWSVAFNPEGQLLVSGGNNQVIRVWHLPSKNYIRTFKGHTNWVWSVACSPNGRFIASGGDDETVNVWDIEKGVCFAKLEGHTNWVWAVAFSPDGHLIASGGDDQTVRVWSLDSGKCLHVLKEHMGRVRTVFFSPNGQFLISAGDDLTIKLWDINTGTCLDILEGHFKSIWSVSTSSDSKFLVSGSADQTIKIWDLSAKKCIRDLTGHTDWVRAVAISSDNKVISSGSDDQTIRLWDFDTGACIDVLTGKTSRVKSVAFMPNKGYLLASGSDDGNVNLWDLNNYLQVLRPLRPYEGMNITNATGLPDATISNLVSLGAVTNE